MRNRVVIVVHDPSLRAAIREVLEQSGHRVTATAGTDELHALLRSALDAPAVVLLSECCPCAARAKGVPAILRLGVGERT